MTESQVSPYPDHQVHGSRHGWKLDQDSSRSHQLPFSSTNSALICVPLQYEHVVSGVLSNCNPCTQGWLVILRSWVSWSSRDQVDQYACLVDITSRSHPSKIQLLLRASQVVGLLQTLHFLKSSHDYCTLIIYKMYRIAGPELIIPVQAIVTNIIFSMCTSSHHNNWSSKFCIGFLAIFDFRVLIVLHYHLVLSSTSWKYSRYLTRKLIYSPVLGCMNPSSLAWRSCPVRPNGCFFGPIVDPQQAGAWWSHMNSVWCVRPVQTVQLECIYRNASRTLMCVTHPRSIPFTAFLGVMSSRPMGASMVSLSLLYIIKD